MSLGGVAGVPLRELRGSFELPPEALSKAGDHVSITASFQPAGWLLERTIAVRREPDGCGCGDIAPAWTGTTLALVRM